jgi:hypothetical protein
MKTGSKEIFPKGFTDDQIQSGMVDITPRDPRTD